MSAIHAKHGVIATDRGGKITIINDMACEALEVDPDDVPLLFGDIMQDTYDPDDKA